MPVVGEDFRQPFLAHRLHRNAIRQAVALVEAVAVEAEAREKRGPAMRDYANGWVFENILCVVARRPPKVLPPPAEIIQIFNDDGFRGDDRARPSEPSHPQILLPSLNLQEQMHDGP